MVASPSSVGKAHTYTIGEATTHTFPPAASVLPDSAFDITVIEIPYLAGYCLRSRTEHLASIICDDAYFCKWASLAKLAFAWKSSWLEWRSKLGGAGGG